MPVVEAPQNGVALRVFILPFVNGLIITESSVVNPLPALCEYLMVKTILSKEIFRLQK